MATTTTAKAVNYTAEQTTAIVSRYTAAPTDETVKALADEFGKTVRSIVAKLAREKVYQKKVYTNKNGEPAVKKNEHADAIGKMLGLSDGDTDSLAKANKLALSRIVEALKQAQSAD